MNLVGRKEAARAVGLSPYALRQGTLTGQYPFCRAGNRYLYDVAELEEALRREAGENQRKARAECTKDF